MTSIVPDGTDKQYDVASIVERVLGEHQERFYGMSADCTCNGWSTTAEKSPEGSADEHRAHLAAKVGEALGDPDSDTWLAIAVRSDAQAERATELAEYFKNELAFAERPGGGA